MNERLAGYTEKSDKFLENTSFEINRTSLSFDALNRRILEYQLETDKFSQNYKKERKACQETFEQVSYTEWLDFNGADIPLLVEEYNCRLKSGITE